MNISTELVDVTPEMASRFLAENNSKNRNLRERVAKKYAQDMANGRWEGTHQGIAFYSDGTLADGQHRLRAVVISGLTVRFLVFRGLEKKSGIAIDMHTQRSIHDALKIGGSPEWINKEVISVSRVLMGSMRKQRGVFSAGEVEEFAIKNSEPIKFAVSATARGKKTISTAPIVACYACAYSAGEPEEMIRRFAEVMSTGEIDGPHENSAIRLREWLMVNSQAGAGDSFRSSVVRRTMRAIYAFCRRTPLSKLIEPADMIYRVPGE